MHNVLYVHTACLLCVLLILEIKGTIWDILLCSLVLMQYFGLTNSLQLGLNLRVHITSVHNYNYS